MSDPVTGCAKPFAFGAIGARVALAIAGAGFGANLAMAQEKYALPQLRLNTPIPALIWRTDVDRNEETIVSSSNYKAVTEWNANDLSPAKIRRVPLRIEEKRRAHSVALSPDGRFLAYAVPPLIDTAGKPMPDTGVVYIFDRKTDKRVRALKAPVRTAGLRFSPDGLYLAAVFTDGHGLRVWSTATDWPEVFNESDQHIVRAARVCAKHVSDRPLPNDTTHLAFDRWGASGYWLAVSGDTGVRLYTLSSGKIERKHHIEPAGAGLCQPAGVDFSPSGRLLAVGDWSDTHVVVLGLSDGTPKPLKNLDLGEMSSQERRSDETLYTVAWQRAGEKQLLFAGGKAWCDFFEPAFISELRGTRRNCVVRWEWSDSAAKGRAFDAGSDTVVDLLALPKSGNLLVATMRSLEIVDRDGKTAVGRSGQPAIAQLQAFDFRNFPDEEAKKQGLEKDAHVLKVSRDGKSVLFDRFNDAGAANPLFLVLHLSDLRLDVPFSPDNQKGLRDPDQDPKVVKNWLNTNPGQVPIVLGKPAQVPSLDPTEISRSIAISRAERNEPRWVLWGTSNHLRLLDMEGRVVCEQRVEAEAYRVNIVEKTAIVAHGDGVLRWYRITGLEGACRFKPLLSLYIHGPPPYRLNEASTPLFKGIAWEPGGKFYPFNSFDARTLLGWSNTNDQVDELRPLDSINNYNEAYIKNAIDVTEPVDPVTAQMDAAEGSYLEVLSSNFELIDKNPRLAFNVVDRRGPSAQTGNRPPATIALTVNGESVAFASGTVKYQRGDLMPIEKAGPHEVEVTIPKSALSVRDKGDLKICLELNPGSSSQSRDCVDRKWTGELTRPARRLTAVVVGVSRYIEANASHRLNLSFAHNDALDLVQLLANDYADRSAGQGGAVADFKELDITLFVAPTGTAAEKQIADLRKAHHPRIRIETNFSKQSILERLKAISEAQRASPPDSDIEDVFLFYFAGHGVTSRAAGLDVELEHLLLPGFIPGGGFENRRRSSLNTDELGAALRKIPSQKVVVLDACKSSIAAVNEKPPRGMSLMRLADRANMHLFVSTVSVADSFEQSGLVFEDAYRGLTRKSLYRSARPKEEAGNGLFSVAFLTSLIDPKSDHWKPEREWLIRAEDSGRFILEYYFDPKRHSRMLATLQEFGQSLPPLPGVEHSGQRKLVLRSLSKD